MQDPQERSDSERFVASREAHAVIAQHASSALRLARVLAGVQDAGDIVQEAMVRALTRQEQYNPSQGSLRAWILGITRLVAFERARERRRWSHSDDTGPLSELADSAGFGVISPEQAMSDEETRHHLTHALALLDPGDRELLVLRDIEGLSGEEVALTLSISVSAQKSRLHRARLRLLGHLRALEDGIMPENRNVGGMSCQDVIQVLSDYVDGELGLGDKLRVESHVAQCSVCERFGGRFRHVVGVMRQHLGAPPAVPDDLMQALRIRLGLD